MNGRRGVFSLFGAGRVGTSLGLALQKAGWECRTIVTGNSKRPPASIRKHFPKSRIVGSASRLTDDFRILFLTVSDDAIAQTASLLAEGRSIDWTGKTVLHTSGTVEVSALDPLKNLGASVGALHPVSAFARRFSPDRAGGIFYDFLGEKRALIVARQVSRDLSSRLVKLGSEKERRLLHIASVMASNFTVIGLQAAEVLARKTMAGDQAGVLLFELLNSTISNLSHIDHDRALTGPLARGDSEVIARHIHALETEPLLMQFYKSSSLLGLDMLIRREHDRKRKRNLTKIKDILEE